MGSKGLSAPDTDRCHTCVGELQDSPFGEGKPAGTQNNAPHAPFSLALGADTRNNIAHNLPYRILLISIEYYYFVVQQQKLNSTHHHQL